MDSEKRGETQLRDRGTDLKEHREDTSPLKKSKGRSRRGVPCKRNRVGVKSQKGPDKKQRKQNSISTTALVLCAQKPRGLEDQIERATGERDKKVVVSGSKEEALIRRLTTEGPFRGRACSRIGVELDLLSKEGNLTELQKGELELSSGISATK